MSELVHEADTKNMLNMKRKRQQSNRPPTFCDDSTNRSSTWIICYVGSVDSKNRSNGGSGGRKGSKNGILQDVGLDEDDGDSTSCSLTSLYNLKTLVNLVQEVRRGLV